MKKGKTPRVFRSVEQFEKAYFPEAVRERELQNSSAADVGARLARESLGNLKKLCSKRP